MVDDSSRTNDSFSQALDVAKAAMNAREQAIQAKMKADHIEELAQQATTEAVNLRMLAYNLASTASAVATVALGTTGAATLKEAYNLKAKTYSKKISMGSFMDIIQVGQGSCYNHMKEEGRLKHWQSNETVLKPPPHRSRNRMFSDNAAYGSETRLHGMRHMPYINDYEPELTPAHSWTKSREYLEKFPFEKFPFPAGVNEHKETLAASFENTGNIKPLWEDRYVQAEASGSHGLASLKHDSWQERKAMKQFQFKLAKAEQDSNEEQEQPPPDDEILKTPKCVLLVRQEEHLLASRCPEDDHEVFNALSRPVGNASPTQVNSRLGLLSPVLPSSRSASPLLNAMEREHYSVSMEHEPTPKPKHKFVPAVVITPAATSSTPPASVPNLPTASSSSTTAEASGQPPAIGIALSETGSASTTGSMDTLVTGGSMETGDFDMPSDAESATSDISRNSCHPM